MNASSSNILINAFMSMLKGIMRVVFPLITFPYVSRVLGVEQLGKYNFAASVLSYFSLIASLGISSYAIREGTALRNSKNKFEEFSNSIFTINAFSTIISYLLLTITVIIIDKISEYKLLIFILSFGIVLQTIGVEWVFNVYEEFFYITIRSLGFQLISMFMMFWLVKTPEDIYLYAIISVISTSGPYLINYFYSKKYCSLHISINITLRKHIIPILLMFATSITIMIYVSSDTTVLGMLCSDYNVGLYSVSVKLYTIIKMITSSVLVVFIPQISFLIGENKKEDIDNLSTNIFNWLIFLLIPIIIGLVFLSKEIIMVISGEEYLEAMNSFVILSISLLFSLGAYFWGQCVLIPFKEEKKLFFITIISAVFNICLNFLIIPRFEQNGAAFTTLVSELVAFIGTWYIGRNKIYLSFPDILHSLFKTCLGSMILIIVFHIIKIYIKGSAARIGVILPAAAIIYLSIEWTTKNSALISALQLLKREKSF